MIDLFQPSVKDKSIEYLRQIFGGMEGLLTKQGEDVGGSITVLGEMFRTFNSVVLALGAIIIVYVTIVGVVKTAHEGEMMGKQWSSLWIPLRMVMGIAALIPTASGYSTLQIVMMWFIIQGIGAADTLWTTVLNHVSVVGSPTAEVVIPKIGVERNIQLLYQGLACAATFKESAANPTGTEQGSYYCAENNNEFCQSSEGFDLSDENKTTLALGPKGACGTLTYCNEAKSCKGGADSLSCKACKKQKEALQGIADGVFATLATQLVKTDYSYRNFVYNNNPAAGTDFDSDWIYRYCSDNGIEPCCVPGAGSGDNQCPPGGENKFKDYPTDASYAGYGNPTNANQHTVNNLFYPYSIVPIVGEQSFISISANEYINALQKNVSEHIQTLQSSELAGKSTNSQRVFQYSKDVGWIMAGTLYYIISQTNNTNLKDAMPEIKFTGTDNEILTAATEGIYAGYRQNYIAAQNLADRAAGQVEEGEGTGTGGAGGAGTGGGGSGGGGTGADTGLGTGGMETELNNALASTSEVFMTNIGVIGGDPAAKASQQVSYKERPNPLVQMQQAGYAMLLIASILWVVLMLIIVIVGAISTAAPIVAGTGIGTSPLEGAMFYFWNLWMPVLFGVLGVLITVGGLMGVYVPLIPYIIFTLGAIGWFLSTVEAMVAGPMVALGILMPGGQNEMLGKATPALMLIFNIFMRPTLMIFGLIASMLLAGVVVDLINQGFGLVITSIADVGGGTDVAGVESTGSAIGFDSAGKPYVKAGAAALAFNPLMLIMILCAYVTLIVTAMNKSFSAIHIIPEKVMRWIGGQGEQYGEGDAVREMKGATEAGGAGAKGAAESGKGATETKGSREGAHQQRKEDQEGKGKGTMKGKD